MKLRIANPPVRYEVWRLASPMNGAPLDVVQKERASSKAACRALVSEWDWVTQNVVIAGVQDFDAGDIEVLRWLVEGQLVTNGYLKVWLSSTAHLKLSPHEYSGKLPKITVPQTVIDVIDQSRSNVKVKSIVDGELELV